MAALRGGHPLRAVPEWVSATFLNPGNDSFARPHVVRMPACSQSHK